jgi:NYN domain
LRDVRANVYVDGPSLYHAALKNTPYKWLNIRRVCRLLLPQDQIHRIRYFTTLPSLFPWDQPRGQPLRTYIRALETLPGLSVHYGSFRMERESLPVSARPDAEREHVVVREAKGTDVALASMLLVDGFRRDYEVAVVVSTDSDLALPMRLVRTRLQLPVGLLKPGPRRSFANELVREAAFYKPIRNGALAAGQFPPQLTDAHGTITKPSGW